MGTVYHWSDRRADLVSDDARHLARRLRLSLLVTSRAARALAPWAVLMLFIGSALRIFARPG
jgi:hypothetical protein